MTICVLKFQTYFQTTIRRGLLHVCCHPHHTNGDFCLNHAINIVNIVPFPNHLALCMQDSSYLISIKSSKSDEIRLQEKFQSAWDSIIRGWKNTGISVIFAEVSVIFWEKVPDKQKAPGNPVARIQLLLRLGWNVVENWCYVKYWKELLSLLLPKVLVSAAHCFNENWEDNSWC